MNPRDFNSVSLLLPDEIRKHYRPQLLRGELVHRATIDSTNRLAAELARGGTEEGTTVVAEQQTAGRGRLGRTWVSPASVNLYMSTVLRPSILNVYQVAPERLELGTLYDNIRVLGNNAQKTSRFEIAFWNKVFYPLAVLVMMVLALPFAHVQRRQGGVGFRIFTGTMIGLSFFLLGRLFSNLGVLNNWPPLFSAVFPLAFFTAIATAMLWWIERR